MRQSGILAAAAIYALDHNVERLVTDHTNAATLAQQLSQCRNLTVEPPETNIVYFDINKEADSAPNLEAKLRKKGVSILALGPQRLRAVTHLHINESDIQEAAKAIVDCVEKP